MRNWLSNIWSQNLIRHLTQGWIGYVAYTKPRIYITNSPEEFGFPKSIWALNKEQLIEKTGLTFKIIVADSVLQGQMDSIQRWLYLCYSKSHHWRDALMDHGCKRFPVVTVIDSCQNGFIGRSTLLGKSWSMEMIDYIRHFFQDEMKSLNPEMKEREGRFRRSIRLGTIVSWEDGRRLYFKYS